jgi:hypothetical protein
MSIFAPEGGDLGPAKKLIDTDVVVYDPDARSGSIAKATVIEGLLAETVASIKLALDAVKEAFEGDLPDKNGIVVGSFGVMAMDLINTLEMMSGYHDAALRPKHRACRAIMVAFLERLKANDLQDGSTEFSRSAFIKDAVAFLESIHICMLESTDRKKRFRWKKRFMDG